MLKYIFLFFAALGILDCGTEPGNEVKVSGAMKNVMWKGELYGTIYLDTIPDKQHLYGLGPAEYLAGEILIIDGRSFISTIKNENEISVEETYKISAPFFVYSNVPEWTEHDLPDSITNIKQLEKYLDGVTQNSKRPFAFKLTGEIETGSLHIVNLPKGAEVHSPEDVRKEAASFKMSKEQVQVIGFFSTEHKGIFTHHDTYLHMHVITSDNKKMGHLEDM